MDLIGKIITVLTGAMVGIAIAGAMGLVPISVFVGAYGIYAGFVCWSRAKHWNDEPSAIAITLPWKPIKDGIAKGKASQ